MDSFEANKRAASSNYIQFKGLYQLSLRAKSKDATRKDVAALEAARYLLNTRNH